MSDQLRERVAQFSALSLPGQPGGMHMGTSYLVSDLWNEVQRLRAENSVLRTLLAKQRGATCPYCGLDDISRCAHGFPGCPWADDLIVGEDEAWRRMQEENKRLRAAVEEASR